MGYIVYKNMSEKEFNELKQTLDSIERISSPIMQMNGFYQNRQSQEDYLNLDYVHDSCDFMGNIGVTYDEEESSSDNRLFRFYYLKAYDSIGERHYKKGRLGKLYTIEEVEGNYISLFQECLSLYNALNKEDLTDKVVLKRTGKS